MLHFLRLTHMLISSRMCHLSVWPWRSDRHVRAQRQDYWQAPWRIPHLSPTRPAGRAGALLPSLCPQPPQQKGPGSRRLHPARWLFKFLCGVQLCPGFLERPRSRPGRRDTSKEPGGGCPGEAPTGHSAGHHTRHPCPQPTLVWGGRAGGADRCSVTPGRDALGGPSWSTCSVSQRLRMHLGIFCS